MSTVTVPASDRRSVTLPLATDCTVPSTRHIGSAGGPIWTDAVDGIEIAGAEDGGDGGTIPVGDRPSEAASPAPIASAAISCGRVPSTPRTATREPEVIGSGVRRWAVLMSA